VSIAALISRRNPAAVLMAMLLLAGCSDGSGQNWQTFKSPQWKFSARFPGEVSEEAVTTFAQFQAASDDADFRIMCSQVPPLSPKRAMAELLAMRDGAAESLHATVAESKNIDVQGQPAIEFTLNFSAGGADMVSYTRYLRCRNLLYQQIVTAPAGTNVEQDIRKFFASLKVETQ